MKKDLFLFWIIYSVTVCSQTVMATENMASKLLTPTLNIDPFVNPMQLQKTGSEESNDDQSISLVTKAARKTFLWQPELRGIIRSNHSESNGIAIANMAGDLIELGMDYEGYRLIKIKEQSVVFEKDGRKYSISMDDTHKESTL